MPRNPSGVYTLPAGNPVVAGTTIEDSWANDTMSDIGNEMSNSLDRTGLGAMSAALKLNSGGSASAPNLTINGDLNTGMWSPAADTIAFSAGGVEAFRYTATTITVAAALSIAALTLSGNLTVAGITTLNGAVIVGDAAGDALTISSSAVSIPNGLNFDSNTLVIDATNNRALINTASSVATESLLVSHTGSNSNAFVVGDRATPANNTGILLRTNGTATIETSNAPLLITLGAVERLRVDTAFNLGLRNSSPSAFSGNQSYGMVIGDGTASPGITIYSGASNGGALSFADGTVGDQQYRGSIEYDHSIDALKFRTAGALRYQMISSISFGPTTNNTQTLGTAALQWSDVRSVLGNFSGQISSSATGIGFQQSSSNGGSDNSLQVVNTSNTAGSAAILLASVGGASADDAYTRYNISGVVNWSTGVDNSSGDIFVISAGIAPGTNDVLRVTTAGAVSIPLGALSVTGGDFDVSRSAGGGTVGVTIANGSNTASSDARVHIQVAGTSAGDAYSLWNIAGGQAYTLGIDNTASDTYVGSVGSALGTNNWLSVATNGAVTFPDADGVTVTGPLTASGGVTGAVTGNASTATALQTPRNINGVPFDGTANITVTAAAGTLTGATLAAGVTASSLTSVGTLSALTVAVGATSVAAITASGTATFNGAVNLGDNAADTVTCTGTPAGQTFGGEYTPTVTIVSNVSGTPSAGVCYYIRMGSYVFVGGQLTIDPTAATTNTSVRISVPIPSNFSATSQARGFVSLSTVGLTVQITAPLVTSVAATDDLQVEFVSSSDIADRAYNFWAIYKII